MADITNQQILDSVNGMLVSITENMATKDDLKGFATKDDLRELKNDLKNFATKDDIRNFASKDDIRDLRNDLKGFATKDDLRNFATKDDIKNFATKDDLKNMQVSLERKIKTSQTVNVQHHLESRAMLGDLNRKFDGLREGLGRAAKAI